MCDAHLFINNAISAPHVIFMIFGRIWHFLKIECQHTGHWCSESDRWEPYMPVAYSC